MALTPIAMRDHARVTYPRSKAKATRSAIAIAFALGGSFATSAAPATARNIVYSDASAHVVQRQPAPGTCRASGSGIYSSPDARCTPGALNPAVRQATIDSTICRGGWTSTVRPSESITEREKFASMDAYGDQNGPSAYEYDHLVPLELGGAVNDARNLWPEPDYAVRAGFYLNPKDHLERALNRLVCHGEMSLATAQRLIATEWVAAFRAHGQRL